MKCEIYKTYLGGKAQKYCIGGNKKSDDDVPKIMHTSQMEKWQMQMQWMKIILKNDILQSLKCSPKVIIVMLENIDHDFKIKLFESFLKEIDIKNAKLTF